MNTPNPLVPQGTFADKGKAHIRNTVFVILAGHLVLLVGLLFAGCNKKDAEIAGTDPTLPQTPTALTGDPWPGSPATPPTQSLPVANPLPPVSSLPPTHITPQTTPTTLTPPTAVADPPVPAGFTEHTVLKNETFSSIGQKYKVGYQAIAAANPGVDPSRLNIGQKIKVPPPRTLVANARTSPGLATGTPDASGEKTHTVKSGDRLYDLAKTYGVTVKQIQAANNLSTTQIRVGQKLKIPSRAPPPVEATAPPPAAPPTTPALLPEGTAPR